MNALALISAAPPRVANSGPVYFIFCALALILSGDPWNFIQSLTTFVTKSLVFCNSKVQFDSPALLSARSVLNLFDSLALLSARSVLNLFDSPALLSARSVLNLFDSPALLSARSVLNLYDSPALLSARSVLNLFDSQTGLKQI